MRHEPSLAQEGVNWPATVRACVSVSARCLPAAVLQVRGHAVEVLQKTEDEELLYYLLQLVQVGEHLCVVMGSGLGLG